MRLNTKYFNVLLILILVQSNNTVPTWSADKPKHDRAALEAKPVLWQRADIQHRNLFYGPGGPQDAPPEGTFTLVAGQRLDGTQQKYAVRDPNGVLWIVKLGPEARAETAATRLIWAVGYFADEDYFVPRVTIANIPSALKGKKNFNTDGVALNARLERGWTEKPIGTWKWKRNPFVGSRELNGLRVLSALMNNSDLKDSNNTITRSKNSA